MHFFTKEMQPNYTAVKKFNELMEPIINEFDDEINRIIINHNRPMIVIESGIVLCAGYINRLRELVVQDVLGSNKEEIYFFKTIKPKFVGQLLYYHYLQQIESKRPKGKDSLVIAFLHDNLVFFNQYLKEQHIGYLYYMRGASHHDKQYFLRKNFHPGDDIYHPYAFMDSEFSTRCDYLLAEFKAHEMVIDYLVKEIDKQETLANKQEPSHVQKQEDTPFK